MYRPANDIYTITIGIKEEVKSESSSITASMYIVIEEYINNFEKVN